MKKKPTVAKRKRRFWFPKPEPKKTEFQLLADAFIYVAHHQDLRSSFLTLADACNKQADAYRAIGHGLNRLADIFEKVRWNDPKEAK